MKIGLQLYTVREFTKSPEALEASLRRAAEIGYSGVQLSAVACMDDESTVVGPEMARRMLDGNKLACAATHRQWERLSLHLDEEIAFHRALGCDYVAIGSPPKETYEQGLEGFRRLADDLSSVASRFAEAGIRFGYHNHAIEFNRIGPERRTPFSVLLERCSDRVCFELDTYWAAYAGVELVPLIESLVGRVPVVHLKDVEPVGATVTFAPIGEGNLDWGRILPALKQAGTQWLMVEQDTCRRDVWDCVSSSYRYLSRALTALL